MTDKLALLRTIARRATRPISDPIPLKAYDPDEGEWVDVSEDGKYFVRFQDPPGEVKDQIYGAMHRTEVVTETRRRGDQVQHLERTTRSAEVMPILSAAVLGGVIIDACLPVEQAGGQIQGWKWKEDNEKNLEELGKFPFTLLGWIVQELIDFIQSTEEVVMDAGESPTQSEGPSGEEKNPTS